MPGNQRLTGRSPGAACDAWFLGSLIPLSSDWEIKSIQAHTLPCSLSPSLPQAIKKHYILKRNKGNGNQKSLFCMRSKTYVENAKWWICTSALAMLPSAFPSGQKQGWIGLPHGLRWGAILSRKALGEPWPDFVLWTSPRSMKWHGIRNTQDASQPWKHLWVQKQRPKVCFVFMKRMVAESLLGDIGSTLMFASCFEYSFHSTGEGKRHTVSEW